LTVCRTVNAFYVGCFLFAISYFNAYLHSLFGEVERSILHSRGLNVSKIPIIFYCDLPYDDCLCSVFLNSSNTSENCITDFQLVSSRILPLVSFLLQIFLVRELFSLSTDRRRIIICALWIASIFIFISMTISIHWSSCSHVYITSVLLLTCSLIWFLTIHNALVNGDRIPSSNRDRVVVTYRPENTTNPNKAWLELLWTTLSFLFLYNVCSSVFFATISIYRIFTLSWFCFVSL
jgi:hypothetical protein